MTALLLDPPSAMSLDVAGVRSPGFLAIAIASVTLLIIALGLLSALFDDHLAQRSAQEAERLRAYVVELEAIKRELEQRTTEVTAALEIAAAGSQAKSQFLANMSHELRTPLNAIIGYSSMQAGGGVDLDTHRQYAGETLQAGQHLLGLINNILDIAQLDSRSVSLDEEEVDVAELVADVARYARQNVDDARLTLRVDVEADLPTVTGDYRRLRQALLNLLSNAAKFTPPPGEICIAARRSETGGLVVAVSDTGIGMAPQHVAVALERFGQIENGLARSYEGAGLGLPLANQIIDLHGGTIAIESAVGAGTTIALTLPAERVLARADAA